MKKVLRLICLLILTTNLQAQQVVDFDSSTVGGFVEDSSNRILKYLIPTAGDVENIIDLSKIKKWDLSKEFLPKTWNQYRQGPQGSCTSFAVAYIISIQKNIDNVLMKDDKTVDQYSPAFIFNYAKEKYPEPDKSNCKQGITFIDAFLVAHDRGIPKLETYRYLSSIDGCLWKFDNHKVDEEAKLTKIGNFQRPFISVENFKDLLVDTPFYPICVGVYLTNEYKNARDFNNGMWIKAGIIRKTLAHAMLIIGFDDAKHAFKAMDWQGKDKGDSGFIWIDYDLIENKDVVFDSYICAHNTIYNLDPQIGNRVGAVMDENGDQDRPKSQAFIVPNNQFKNDSISFWIKSGYYTRKDSFEISCNFINDKTNLTTLRVNKLDPLKSLIKDDIMLSVGSSFCFIDNGINYKIKLQEISHRGTNFLKKAAVLLFIRNEPCSIESNPSANNNFHNDMISFWIKAGYFSIKDSFRIYCAALDNQSGKAIFRINKANQQDSLVEDDIILTNGSGFCFVDHGISYKLTLIEIASRGRNPLKKAAVLKFSRNQTCSEK